MNKEPKYKFEVGSKYKLLKIDEYSGREYWHDTLSCERRTHDIVLFLSWRYGNYRKHRSNEVIHENNYNTEHACGIYAIHKVEEQ